MPADPFRSWLTRHVWPVLKPAGFVRHGRRFARVMSNGTETGVCFDRLGLLPGRRLPIEIQISGGTHTSRAWVDRIGTIPTEPGSNEPYLWVWQTAPPPEMAHPLLEHLWGIDPTGDDDRGAYLAMCLAEEWLPVANKLTDLATFEAELRKPQWELPGKITNTHEAALALLIAAQRDDPEIDRLADDDHPVYPDPDGREWLHHTLPRGPWAGSRP